MIRQGLFIALAAGAVAVAAQTGGGTSALRNHNGNAPVDVSADRIELQDRADRAVFSGNVRVTQAEMTMDAARMTVAYRNAPGQDPQVQRIDASGGVTVTSPTETARGSTGIYDLDRRLITLLGNVRLTRGANSVNGGRLVIDLTSGRSTIDGRSAGGDGVAGTNGGRVTGRFTVPQRNQ